MVLLDILNALPGTYFNFVSSLIMFSKFGKCFPKYKYKLKKVFENGLRVESVKNENEK